MPDLQEKLSELLQRYERDKTKPRTEADVSANFIDQLFAALGWDITNPNEYNRQRYVREAGFADIGLLLRGEPKVFVEVKRFGLIPKSTERRGDRTTVTTNWNATLPPPTTRSTVSSTNCTA